MKDGAQLMKKAHKKKQNKFKEKKSCKKQNSNQKM